MINLTKLATHLIESYRMGGPRGSKPYSDESNLQPIVIEDPEGGGLSDESKRKDILNIIEEFLKSEIEKPRSTVTIDVTVDQIMNTLQYNPKQVKQVNGNTVTVGDTITGRLPGWIMVTNKSFTKKNFIQNTKLYPKVKTKYPTLVLREKSASKALKKL